MIEKTPFLDLQKCIWIVNVANRDPKLRAKIVRSVLTSYFSGCAVSSIFSKMCFPPQRGAYFWVSGGLLLGLFRGLSGDGNGHFLIKGLISRSTRVGPDQTGA